MYESFYGLKAKPFQLNPDPSFYYASKQHRRASAYLEYGVHQNEGFIVITGEIGAGKTTIVRGLLESLEQTKLVAAQLVSTQLDADDILRMVAAAFGVGTRNLPKAELILALEAFFVDVARQGKRCLLVVDEAQNLTPKAVEELRMLSNFQFGSQALLQSFLVGQPEFRGILNSPQMQQLRQRVIAACHIGPLDLEEVTGYIKHRLTCAGAGEKPSFQPEAFEAIHRASGGIPRRINALCDRLLLFGFLSERSVFTEDDVLEVVAESSDQPAAPPMAIDEAIEEMDGDIKLDEDTANELNRTLSSMKVRSNDERLIRLERSLLRLERSHSVMLNLLQRLVNSARTVQLDSSRRSGDKKAEASDE